MAKKMPPFTAVMRNWKNQSRAVGLKRLNYIHGPNGSGKSSILQAVQVALTGALPDPFPKTNQALGKFFSADEGEVTLVWAPDRIEPGHAVTRRFTRKDDRCSVAISSSDTPAGSKTEDLSRWASNVRVLDFESFDRLKPEAKATYILELCGVSEESPKRMLEEIRARCATVAGGPQAKPSWLKEVGKFPEGAKRELAIRWVREGGIFDHLASLSIWGTASEICLRYLEEGRGQRNDAAQTLKKTRAALEELEREDLGHVPRQVEIDGWDRKAKELQRQLAKYEAVGGELSRRLKEAARADQDVQEIEAGYRALQKRMDALPESMEPRREDYHFGGPASRSALRQAAEVLERAQENVRKAQGLQERVTGGEARLEAIAGLRAELLAHHHQKLAEVMEEIPDDAHPRVRDLRQLVAVVSKEHRQRIVDLKQEADELLATVSDLKKELAELGGPKDWEARLPKYRADRDGAERRLADEERRRERARDDYQRAYDAFRAAREERERVLQETRLVRAELGRQKARKSSIDKRIAALGRECGPDDGWVEAARAELPELEEKCRAGHRQIGAVRSHESLRRQADSLELDLEAWGVVLEAAQDARERALYAASAPLLEVANELYHRARPTEDLQITLETPTGARTCQFQLSRQGTRIDREALSAGEWCLALSAFQHAAMRRSGGLRCLLVEAQALDERNLRLLFEVLRPEGSAQEAHLVLVASTIEPSDGVPPKGWHRVGCERRVSEELEAEEALAAARAGAR